MDQGQDKKVILGTWCALYGNLGWTIIEKAHGSHYSIYLGATKMGQDLKRHFWWRRMKTNIFDHVTCCMTCQHVNYEHLKPGGISRKLVWEQYIELHVIAQMIYVG